MPLTISQFVDRLKESGVLPPDEFAALAKRIPKDKRRGDAVKLSTKLIETKTLTQHQASAILAGEHKTLVLGDYVILTKIGSGGMGQVYKARHRRMKRLVAIKVLPAALTSNPDAIKRFQREVEAAARLSHPNIVASHDAGEQKGVHYLVMEYVEGDDLANAVKKQGPLPVEQAVNYVVQAARGLAHAHSEGVIHRDIKPANLLVDGHGTIKILDMGLARFERAAGEASEGLTQSGTLMGTIDYMSPEQAIDTKNADGRADIYSLGCTLFFLLTGKRVYEGETMMKRLVAHRDAPIPALTAERADVPAGLPAVFEKMVAKRPADRYQSMNELSAALLALTTVPELARSLASAGDQTVVATPHTHTEGPPAIGRSPHRPPPRPSANTAFDQSELATRDESVPGLAPLSIGFEPAQVWHTAPAPPPRVGPAVSVWRVFDTPVWVWAAVGLRAIDQILAQIAGAGNTVLHVLLRCAAVGLLLSLFLTIGAVGFVALNLWFSSKPPGKESGNEVTQEDASPPPKTPVAGKLPITKPIDSPSAPAALIPAKPVPPISPGSATPTVPTVPSPATGSLSLRPIAALTLRPGDTDLLTIGIDRVGCEGRVDVSAINLPRGVTTGGLTLYAAQDRSEMQFAAAPDVVGGAYTITLVARLGTISATRTFRLTIDKPVSAKTPLPSKPPVVIGGGGGVVTGGGSGGSGVGVGGAPKPNPVAFDLDSKAHSLRKFDLENLHAAYEGKSFVLEVRKGKRTNTSIVLGDAVNDFDFEARCRLTGNSSGARMTVVFRDAVPTFGQSTHLTWWLNSIGQATLVRQTFTAASSPTLPPTMKETRLTEWENVPVLKRGAYNKLRLRARGPVVEMYVNDKLFRRIAAGDATYKTASRQVQLWLTKDSDQDEAKLELTEIKVTRLVP